MKRKWIFHGFKFAVFGVLAAGVFGLVVMGLWNALMPAIFGLKVIGYWQALGLLLLSRIFFHGLRGGGGFRGMSKARWIERWERLTPEEREKFRAGMRGGHCGPRPGAALGDQAAV